MNRRKLRLSENFSPNKGFAWSRIKAIKNPNNNNKKTEKGFSVRTSCCCTEDQPGCESGIEIQDYNTALSAILLPDNSFVNKKLISGDILNTILPYVLVIFANTHFIERWLAGS